MNKLVKLPILVFIYQIKLYWSVPKIVLNVQAQSALNLKKDSIYQMVLLNLALRIAQFALLLKIANIHKLVIQ